MMKQILIISLIACFAMGRVGFLASNYPYPSKFLTLTLDENFTTVGIIDSLGEVRVPFDISSIYSYFTSPQCANCEIYSDTEQQPFVCSSANYCNTQQGGYTNRPIDNFYNANVNLVQMQMKFDGVPAYVSQVLYVQSINQLKAGQGYDYQNIGLALDENNTSFLLYSLQEQGKIDNLSYSYYYGPDNKYHMTIGGYNIKMLSKQFYNIQSFKAPIQFPYNIANDFLIASIKVNGVQILQGRQVFLDPTIDTFIFTQSDMYAFQNVYLAQSKMPDLSDLSFQQPGVWSSLSLSPSLTISFSVDDADSLTNFMDVNFSAEELMTKTSSGGYTPNLIYKDRYDQPFENVIIMGKQIFRKMMYYKYVANKTTIRCLAPLKNVKPSSV